MSEGPGDDTGATRLHEDDIWKIASVVADLLNPAMTMNPAQSGKMTLCASEGAIQRRWPEGRNR